jgi:hypothetical protein
MLLLLLPTLPSLSFCKTYTILATNNLHSPPPPPLLLLLLSRLV